MIPSLIGIYRKSLPPRVVVRTFLVSFTAGALGAGATMNATCGGVGAATRMAP